MIAAILGGSGCSPEDPALAEELKQQEAELEKTRAELARVRAEVGMLQQVLEKKPKRQQLVDLWRRKQAENPDARIYLIPLDNPLEIPATP